MVQTHLVCFQRTVDTDLVRLHENIFGYLDFCLTVHHQLGKVIQMNQLDATMIY